MTSLQEALASAARELIGVPFRPQGRDPLFGLDCVGVVASALAAVGRSIDVPRDYAQRGGDHLQIMARIDALPGLARIKPDVAGWGDVLLMMPGAAQWHFGILTAHGLVHADAGLRCVVETPGTLRWPVLGVWRVADKG